MTAGAKTKLQVDGVISILSPSATNGPQATEVRPRLYGEKLSRVEGSPALPSQLLTTVYISKVVPVD